ncbi:ATP-binding protein [Streptomyces chumphonensis]|uniref:ATP-binding protein n=1 Tax=Streptomyces chumphonensis TaxID=1214925 RepID=UPI003D74DE65
MTQRQTTSRTGGTEPLRLELRLSAGRRGVRLARRLAVQQFTEWTGLPHHGDAAYAVALVTDELAANAVAHGTVPGRDFALTLLLPAEGVLRVEVTDSRPERGIVHPANAPGPPDAESGRGLLLVAVYAARWGCVCRDALTKTVWAEVAYS